MNEAKKTYPPRRKQTWQDKIVAIISNSEPKPEDFLEIAPNLNETEPFVLNAWKNIIQAAFVSVKFAEDAFTSPQKLGGMVGHKVALLQYMEVFWEKFVTNMKRLAETGKIAELQNADEIFVPYEEIECFRKDTLRAVQRCFAIVLKQNARDAGKFFAGFAEGIENGVLTKTGKLPGMNATTVICIWVVMLQGKIRTLFQSVSEFHKFLEKRHGHNVSGSLERVQKLCQRLELNFGRPGRPRKKNSDKRKISQS